MYEGVLNIYKERGFTSHDVVAKLRGILKMKKIGHTGTLDPDAEGVLPVCLGQATRLCDMLTDEGKVYRAVMLLGVETDTQDASGQVLARRAVTAVSEKAEPAVSAGQNAPDRGMENEISGESVQERITLSEKQVTEAIRSFIGPYDQIPPMYSALKVNGKKLYELARQGKTVERQARPVVIHRIDIESVELPRVTMAVHCSKGTYIRTLCHDIGQKLGCGACMESLLRVRVGRFTAEESLRLAQVEQLRDSGGLAKYIVPVEEMFSGYPKACALPEADTMARNGNPLRPGQVRFENGCCGTVRMDAGTEAGETEPGMAENTGRPDRMPERSEPENGESENRKLEYCAPGDGREYRVYDSCGAFLGIYVYEQEKDRIKPWKLFLSGHSQ